MFSAPLHKSVCLPHSYPNFLGGNRVLWKFVLSSYILSDTSETKHHPIRRTSFTSHPDTNIYRHTRRPHPCKVWFLSNFSNDRTQRYNPCICFGFALWTIGLGLQTTFSPDISLAKFAGYLVVEGFGIGFTFQTSMTVLESKLIASACCGTSNLAKERPRCRDRST